DHGAALRIHALHSERNGVHFLNEFRAEILAQAVAARTGSKHARARCREALDFGFEALQELKNLFGLFGVVTLIVLPENLVCCSVDDHGFNRGRPDVHADEEIFVHVSWPVQLFFTAFMHSEMCMTKFAAWPTTPLVWGT